MNISAIQARQEIERLKPDLIDKLDIKFTHPVLSEPTVIGKLGPRPVADRQPNESGVLKCWSCGYGFMKGKGLCKDWFCSEKCREWFDNGEKSYSQNEGFHPDPLKKLDKPWKVVAGNDLETGTTYLNANGCPAVGGPCDKRKKRFNQDGNILRASKDGFVIYCVNCHKEFESKGYSYCSKECKRQYKINIEDQKKAVKGNQKVSTKLLNRLVKNIMKKDIQIDKLPVA